MLVGILGLYALIIGFGESQAGGPLRVALLWFLLWRSAMIRTERSLRRISLVVGGIALIVASVITIFASDQAAETVVGAISVLLIGAAGAVIAYTILQRHVVDVSSVLGVLCIYLLFALFFASLHQVLAAYIPHYLNGTGDPATPADLLYFSVITLATVGFGDITPVSEVARAVTVLEALVGQLYLVSVVAGVVAGWRGSTRT
jgi:hypothetical protein